MHYLSDLAEFQSVIRESVVAVAVLPPTASLAVRSGRVGT